MEENSVNQNQKKFSTFIQNYSDVSFMHLSETNLIEENDCSDMIQTVNNYAELDVVFCISMVKILILNFYSFENDQIPVI